jgi:Tol biopolymer transport system component
MIAYGYFNNGDRSIWVIPVEDGGLATRLTDNLGDDACPDWSPDGSKIAFNSDRAADLDIWVVSSIGGSPTRITSLPGGAFQPSWSPDGSQIAFSADFVGPANDICVVPAAGGVVAQITDDPAYDAAPDWSPDGDALVFYSQRSGNLDIWVISLLVTPVEETTWGAIKAMFR